MITPRTRREFLTDATGFTAATLLGARALGSVHSSVDDTIRVAVVGCGSRGAGAAVDALSVTRGPVKLIAMADVFQDRVARSHEAITSSLTEDPASTAITGLDVPPERRFVGFDGYRHAMDCLKPGDIVILATPPAFRWVHFKYAIERGLNVFMEKPLCVDGPTGRRMLELAELSRERDLKVAVGLMGRHNRGMQELARRVQDGELGEIITQHGYRMQGSIATFRSPLKPEGVSELEYQLRRFHSFLWASGGGFNDFFIHIIDGLCWMKGAWPQRAQALGGRHYRSRDGVLYIDQNLDTYAVEYTYPDGTKLMFDGRNIDGCQERFMSYMHGTKGSAIVSAYSDCGSPASIHRLRTLTPESLVWRAEIPAGENNPYQNEWNDFVAAIRDGKKYNEARYGIEASIVCNMGRMAAHTGREITFDEILACPHEFAPGVDSLTVESPAPLLADAEGRYPVPQPGVVTDREY
ncbi:MAG: Gfo/Idh/MocA family oxidoreductase [Phycisphaerales bacterium]|nr:Gfo/Idh/MocA family oxidoreductase [Phycisphaerales bacterium]